ncbi:hypothetical protein [Rhodococcus sp. H29-C3]|uniref:hypothetical protein n=1 Tax=Rhodococcus sp. H29-C3 TaxID=3046307 RepID=UPI0024BA9C3F|nr:hypothetical protein [Rhodococcus sp. H29-C3]MDJ0363133.1 hypothetical protein [Rhodococcus sp. H29-C3]
MTMTTTAHTMSQTAARRDRALTQYTRTTARMDAAARSGKTVDITDLLRTLEAWAEQARAQGATETQIENASLAGLS